MQPPWSMAQSTITAAGFIVLIMSSVTSTGARPPGTSTAPMTRSASATARATAPRLLASVMIRPWWIWSTQRSRSRFLSSRSTSASMPCAIHAAFQPTLPAPSTTTRAGRTPGAPPSSTPRPPCARSRKCAPICGAMRPATSLIGASSGSCPFASCTVSYATPVVPAFEQRARDIRVRGEMQVREQHEVGAQVRELLLLRFLHLEHEPGARPHVFGARRRSRRPRRGSRRR